MAKACQQDGGFSCYELPVNVTRCPVCGSKRIKRLYDSINVLRGVPDSYTPTKRDISHIIDNAGSEAQASAERARDARLQAQKANAPMFAVPLKQLGTKLQQFGINPQVPLGGSRPSLTPAMPLIQDIHRHPPRPGPDSLRDGMRLTREGKVVKETE